MKKLFGARVGTISAFVLALSVSACAAPGKIVPTNQAGSKSRDASSTALAQFRRGIRQSPIFDAYAERYPQQWQTNTSLLWPKIRQALSGRNPQRDRAAFNAVSEQMAASNLMKDIAIVQRNAVGNLSEAHATRINALGIENMVYLRNQSPQACAKLMMSDPAAYSLLSPELRAKQQALIGEMIASAPDKPVRDVDSKTIGRLLAQIDNRVRDKYPNYPGWDKLSLATNDAAVHARNCDYSVEHSKIVANLSAGDRLAVVRFTRRAASTSASLESWKTRVYRIAGTTTVHIVGPMHMTMFRSVQQLVKDNPELDTVLLDSPGGLILAGQNLAALIQQRQMKTRVSHICMSACTIALLAGKERVVSDTALIGFHDSVVSGKSLATVGASAGYYTGVYGQLPKEFLDRVKATPNKSMWVPNKSDLLAAKVVTRVQRVSPSPATMAQLGRAYESNKSLSTEVTSNQYFWANEKRRLAALESFGASDDIIQFYIRDIHRASLRTYWQQMPDELAERAAQQTVDIILAIKNDQPALCADIFVGEPLSSKENGVLSQELLVQADRLRHDLIRKIGFLRSTDSRVAKPDNEDLKRLLPVVGPQPRRDTNWFIQSLKSERKPTTDPATCQILANLMRAIIAQPSEQRGESFRLMQQITVSWKSRDRYGNPLPYSRSFADFISLSQ